MNSEDRNYYRDHRVQALSRNDLLQHDSRTMTATWTHEDEDGNEIVDTFPTKYKVCDTCDGRGKHTDPNIDASGICAGDEFWEDDRDDETGESRYQRGDYDVSCYGCGGLRVMAVIDEESCDETLLKAYQEALKEEADYRQECRMEREYGC